MNALEITARSTSTDSQVPEYRVASVSNGATSFAQLADFPTPNPTDIVHVMNTYQTTATTAAVRIARGMARRGSAASSPRTAAASKPMKPVKAKTTARNSPCVDGSFDGLSGCSVTPESPPLASTMIASSRIAATPKAPTTSCNLVVRRMSRNANTSRPARSSRKHVNQPGCQPVWFVNRADMVTDAIASTEE